MNKKLLVAAIAVATAAAGTSAFAATKMAGATQKGSLLIFPRIVADTLDSGRGFSDTLVSITNDSSRSVEVQCYWGTTEQFGESGPTGSGGNAAKNDKAIDARKAIRNNHFMDFAFKLTAHQPASFWAGDLSLLANGFNPVGGPFAKLITNINAPQFNFFQDGTQANAGELKCWAVNSSGRELHFNHLMGKAAVVTFAPDGTVEVPTAGGQAHEYNAWSFQALFQGSPDIKHTGRPATAKPGVIKLDGVEYDQCPSALAGQFIPTAHTFGLIQTRTQISVSNCHEDLRQDADTHITKLTYTVWNANENKYTGAHECMGAWYESDLGQKFPHFTYRTLKTDTAYFRAQPTASRLCNQGSQTAAMEADIEESGVVGIMVSDVSGLFQTSSNLTGLGAGTNDYKQAKPPVGQIQWDPGKGDLGKK